MYNVKYRQNDLYSILKTNSVFILSDHANIFAKKKLYFSFLTVIFSKKVNVAE